MTAGTPIPTSNTVTYQGPTAAPPAAESSDMSFSELLSDMNPLQYLPVIGTIYRAVTGDTIPQPMREIGSAVVAGLIGGPIGLATNLASLAFQKLTGLDFEDIEQGLIGSLHATPAAVTQAEPSDNDAKAPAATAPDTPPSASPWTAAQLAAYGIVQRPDGELQQGDLIGADVLNALQLRTAAQPLAAAA